MWIFKRILFYISLIISLQLLLIFILIVIDSPETNIFGWGLVPYLIIPIIILSIFQIKYLINNKLKIVEVIIILIISLFEILSVSIPQVINKMKYNKKIDEGYSLVNNYLKNKFGEDNFNDMVVSFSSYDDGCHIICTDYPVFYYKVDSNLVESNFTVVIEEKNEVCDEHCKTNLSVQSDSFLSELILDLERTSGKKFEEEYLKQLFSDNKLPDNVELDGAYRIITENLDFSKSYSFDDLLKHSTYHINSFDFKLKSYSKEETLETVKNLYIFYNGIKSKLYNYDDMMFFHGFDISLNKWVVSGYVKPTTQNKLKITLEPYIDTGGIPTIEKSEELIDY